MVDVLTARFQNQLGNLLNGDSVRSRVSEPQDLFDASNLPHIARLAREKHKQEQLKKRELANKISSKQLLNIKEKEWGVFLANTKSNVGLSCSACTPDSRVSIFNYSSSLVKSIQSNYFYSLPIIQLKSRDVFLPKILSCNLLLSLNIGTS